MTARSKYLMNILRCHEKSKTSTLWQDVSVPEASRVYLDLFGRDRVLEAEDFHYPVLAKARQLVEFTKLPLDMCFSYLVQRSNKWLTWHELVFSLCKP
jgi:hypothetical protein